MTDQATGIIEVRRTGVGSKSEMPSVVLCLDDQEDTFVPLRRREATSLDVEPELAEYAGRRVRVTGSQLWTTFVVDSIEEVEPLPG